MLKSLSIIIPAYNDARQLRACLASIAVQTDAPDEVLVVDNNSTDDTAKVCGEFVFVSRITCPRQGIVYARDTGFNAASGDILARIDADTILPNDWVKRVRRFYADPDNRNCALTGGGYFYNIHFHRLNGWVQSQFAYRVNRLVIGYYVLWGSNMAITRTQWKAVRGVTCNRQDIHEDLDLAFHLHHKGFSIMYDGSLRVGVKLKRVLSDKDKLQAHMRRWPQSLRSHGYRGWWLGVAGNQLLWWIVRPIAYGMERSARLVLGEPRYN